MAVAAGRNASRMFLAVLAACLYVWLSMAQTTDAALLTNSPFVLPIIQTQIPHGAFYALAPVLLVAMYLSMHLQLQRLWQTAAELPAVFPDDQSLDRKVHPSLLVTGVLGEHVPWLRDRRPPFGRLQLALGHMWASWVDPTENADGTATLTYRLPSHTFGAYQVPALDAMAKDLDRIVANIVADAGK